MSRKSERLEVEPGVFVDRFEAATPKAATAGEEISESRRQFNPADWYWQIKGDVGFVWSSARAQRVDIEDQQFKLWLDEGGNLTYIADIDEMRDVWAKYGIIQDAGAQYRQARKLRYIAELRKPGTNEDPTFENTTGDVFDIVIAQVEAMRQALGAPATPEFAALIALIQTIKTEVPKPS